MSGPWERTNCMKDDKNNNIKCTIQNSNEDHGKGQNREIMIPYSLICIFV